jgi:hypothetical protein
MKKTVRHVEAIKASALKGAEKIRAHRAAAVTEATAFLFANREKMSSTGWAQATKGASRRAIASLYDNVASHPNATNLIGEWVTNMVRTARSNGQDGAGVRQIAAHMLSRGDRWPDSLRDYVIEFLWDSTPPVAVTAKKGARTKTGRDVLIRQIVSWISRRYDLKPTRNLATEAVDSGCSIVTEARKKIGIVMQEDAVVKIWNGRRKK